MGKLKELVKDESSLASRLKYNAHRVRMASLGLISKVEAERTRIYKQLLEAGQGAGDQNTFIGVINTLGAGAAKLAREQSQRLFEELVQAGEQAVSHQNGGSQPAVKAEAKPKAKVKARQEKAETIAKAAPPVKAVQPQAVASHHAASLKDSLQKIKSTLAKLELEAEEHAQLEALYLQAAEGDVAGRRPAAGKAEERMLFDARKAVKGLSPEAAIEQFNKQIKALKKAVPA